MQPCLMQKKLTYSFRNNVSKIPVRNLRRVKIRGKWEKNFRTSQNQLAKNISKDIMKEGIIENMSPFFFSNQTNYTTADSKNKYDGW